MKIRKLWCIACDTEHEPTPEHPECHCAGEPFPRALHEVIPADAHIDHRGWRFFFPFHCFNCGDPICMYQFAFSRTCGWCDVSNSTRARVRGWSGRAFAGRHERLDVHDDGDINPKWLDPQTRENYPRLWQPNRRGTRSDREQGSGIFLL